MKNTVYNQAQAQADQSNVDMGMFGTLMGAIVAVVILMIIGVITLGVIKGVTGKKTSDKSVTPGSQEIKALEMELQELQKQ